MRVKLVAGNKPDKCIHNVRNADSTTILKGTPVVLNLSSTPQPSAYANGLPSGWEDGLQVVQPATGGATPANYFLYGVAIADILAGQLGEAQIHGVVNYSRVTVMTRSATNATAASVASVNSGGLYVPDTVNNSWTLAAGGTIGAGINHGILLDTVASVQSKASNDVAWSGLGVVQTYRMFVRLM